MSARDARPTGGSILRKSRSFATTTLSLLLAIWMAYIRRRHALSSLRQNGVRGLSHSWKEYLYQTAHPASVIGSFKVETHNFTDPLVRHDRCSLECRVSILSRVDRSKTAK